MRNHATFVLALAAALPAQNWIETFTYPDGPIPATSGWTVRSGTWAVKNQAVVQSTTTWGYLTKDGLNPLNSVVEADCSWIVAGLQFAGVAARHPGTAIDDSILAKIQSDSATPQGFSSGWLYERNPSSSISKTGLSPNPQKVRVRLVVLNATATMTVDTNMDGVFDLLVGSKAINTHTAPGLVGVVGYASGAGPQATPTQIDNFAFYEGVLAERAGNTAKLGSTWQMDLYTPATQITPFVGVAALSGGTIPIGGNRGLPLAFDPLFDLSLQAGSFFGLVGVTDATGQGAPAFNIPNLPQIVGLRVFTAAVLLDATQPLGIGAISNNLSFVIQP